MRQIIKLKIRIMQEKQGVYIKRATQWMLIGRVVSVIHGPGAQKRG